jgi:dihydropteroate synthase
MGRLLGLNKKTCIMGILNVTPDSFSDGGKYFDKGKAVEHALRMVREGASIIDVGGESTRPGARDVSVNEELLRVIPVVKAISKKTGALISIDTKKAEVAARAIEAGATIINDISALNADPLMAKVAAKYSATVILMHMKGTPRDMQKSPRYSNLISEIKKYFKRSIHTARRAGINEKNIIIDPGIGFGKTVNHNLEILNRLDEFKEFGRPICVGVSRKSFIGKVLGSSSTDDRLAGTIAACVFAITKGAQILRVHDVAQAAQAAAITDSIMSLGAH